MMKLSGKAAVVMPNNVLRLPTGIICAQGVKAGDARDDTQHSSFDRRTAVAARLALHELALAILYQMIGARLLNPSLRHST
jgi:hypothetical protein